MKTAMIILVLAAVPALAQEPSAPIKSAETVTVAASHPCTSEWRERYE